MHWVLGYITINYFHEIFSKWEKILFFTLFLCTSQVSSEINFMQKICCGIALLQSIGRNNIQAIIYLDRNFELILHIDANKLSDFIIMPNLIEISTLLFDWLIINQSFLEINHK